MIDKHLDIIQKLIWQFCNWVPVSPLSDYVDITYMAYLLEGNCFKLRNHYTHYLLQAELSCLECNLQCGNLLTWDSLPPKGIPFVQLCKRILARVIQSKKILSSFYILDTLVLLKNTVLLIFYIIGFTKLPSRTTKWTQLFKQNSGRNVSESSCRAQSEVSIRSRGDPWSLEKTVRSAGGKLSKTRGTDN